MNWHERKKMVWKWAFLATSVAAAFWMVWSLVAGSVPETTIVKMMDKWNLELPFAVSRWWDVPAAAILAALIVLVTSEWFFDSDAQTSLVFVLVAALGLGLFSVLTPVSLVGGLIIGSAIALGSALGIAMFCGQGLGLVYDLGGGLFSVLGTALGLGLAFGLVSGLAFGLAVTLVFALIVGPVFSMVFGLAILIRRLAIANY